MTIEDILNDARSVVKKVVPDHVEITQVDFEGPTIVIYTKNMEVFAESNDLVRQIAQQLRRRIVVRPDPSLLATPEEAEKVIREVIPPEAQITGIYFETETGEVTIEALSPGMVIGRHGSILNEVKKKIGWAPKVVRTPPIPSKTVEEIRQYLRTINDERQTFLKQVGRRLAREVPAGENYVRITALGGFRQVGRSAALLSTRESKVLIDCGVLISEDNGSPYLNAPEVTPLRDLMSLLQLDFIKVAMGEARKSAYDSSHIRKAVANTIPLKYGETTDIAPDIRLTFQNAGHILGSGVAHFHIGDGLYNVAMSGDIKFEKTWLFNPAVNKFPRLETLVLESTYGGYHDIQPSRHEAAQQLKEVLRRVLTRGGKVLVPVFAVGRSQEVMLVLEDAIRNHQIPEVPIYLDGMIWEATAIHTAYPEYLNSQLRTQIFQTGENPFLSPMFKRVETADMRANIIDDVEPCIVLATSGMMSGGPILEYFKGWADNPLHALVFVGFQSEGSLGRRIQREAREITLTDRGQPLTLPIKMDVETVDGFSGHSDRLQLLNYVGTMEPRPERVIVNHGEEFKCSDLASGLYKKFGLETRAPMNLETIRLK
ncbi:MAG: beta-CASP ribonuclease aCPSF1 [Methanobacteriota archaeon]|nr:MAG: beta-CASP ribonuclease aCPSF1 [Euryarchaeota archaeon]